MATLSWYNDGTFGDVILKPVTHDDGSLGVLVVNTDGSPKVASFSQIVVFTDGGGHAEAHCRIIADGLGFERENERLKVAFD